MTAADKVQDSQVRLASAIIALGPAQRTIDNIIRYVEAPRTRNKRAYELMIEAVATLGVSHQGNGVIQRCIATNERFEIIKQKLRDIKDELDDLALEIQDNKDRANRWEGDIRQ